MLLSIRKRSPGERGEPGDLSREAVDAEGPAELLVACHGRIRSFTRVAGVLASAAATAALPAEIAEAAGSLERYHRIALPLHEADEDASIRPRLEAASVSDEVKVALARVHAEHLQMDALVAELLVYWAALAAEPTRLAELSPRLAAPGAALALLWDPHLLREEALIFPAVEALPAETQRLIAAEMRARRGGGGAGLEIPSNARTA